MKVNIDSHELDQGYEFNFHVKNSLLDDLLVSL